MVMGPDVCNLYVVCLYTGGPVGGCQVSTSSQAHNMGYIQSQPVVTANGTLTLRYLGGDLCHKGTPNEATRSTRINFFCSPSEVRVHRLYKPSICL